MADINPVLEARQEETLVDVFAQLNARGKSIFIRPTGFGKTFLLVQRLAKHYIDKGKKVIYVYPLDIIVTEITAKKLKKEIDSDGKPKTKLVPNKYFEDGKIKLGENFEFISYQKLSREFNNDNDYWYNKFSKDNIGLIILDEAHRAGSETFYAIWETIKPLVGAKGIHVVGATATPDRMDDCNDKESVLEHIFDNIQTREYSLADSIIDGIMPEIVYMLDDLSVSYAENKGRKLAKQTKNGYIENSYNVEIGKQRKDFDKAPDTIVRALRSAGYNPVNDKYYKFIVFLVNINDVAEYADEIEKWFEHAFNEILFIKYSLKKKFNIRVTYLTSSDTDGRLNELVSKKSNRQYFNHTKKIETLTEEDYTVDIVLTVDMVNMGYHVPNITGIVMKRGTKSEITYYQQLGRALSVTATHKPIVLDFTNNLSEHFWFKKEAKAKTEAEAKELRQGRKLLELIIKQNDSINAFNTLFEKLKGGASSFEKDELNYLYNEMHMPIYVLAAFKGWTIVETVKKLVKSQFKIVTEQNQYELILKRVDKYKDEKDTLKDQIKPLRDKYNRLKLNEGKADKRELDSIKRQLDNLIKKYKAAEDNYLTYSECLKFINYKDAVYGKCRYITNKSESTLYETLNKKNSL